MKLTYITDFLILWGSLLAYSVTFSTIGTDISLWFSLIPLSVAFLTLLIIEAELTYEEALKDLSSFNKNLKSEL